MKRQHLWNICMLAALAVLGVPRAHAASLQKVEQSTWGSSSLPSYVNMYIYVPDKLAPQPPILVASHHCGGSANTTFNETKASFVALADKNGFVIIFPEATGHNCWDVGSAKSLQHDGGGDTHAIAQMVRYTLSKYDGDPSRVVAFGTSSGAMMTEALLGVYADLFIAGVSVAGVPCGCWAEQYTGDSGANPQWSGPCAGGSVTKTAQQWGDLVRAMDPGYSGHRPRVQLWHGTADTTISFNNLGESIKEWTNILQLSEMPSASDSAKSGYMHRTWKNSCGYVSLEAWAQQGAGHDVSWDAASAESFLGLDQVGGLDPEARACPSTASSAGAGGNTISAAGIGGERAIAGARSESAGRGGAGEAGRAAHEGSAGAGHAAAVSGSGSGGMPATAARAGDQAAPAAGRAATPSTGAPASAAASSSGGCSCVLLPRAPPSTTSLTLMMCGVAWLVSRSRAHRVRRRRAAGSLRSRATTRAARAS